MSSGPLTGFELSLPSELEVTPTLVSAAYKRAVRLGLYWRLKPEERAILTLARKLRAVKSPALKQALIRILSKVWPERARLYQAFMLGLEVAWRRLQAALKIGAVRVAEFYSSLAPREVLHLGLAAMSIPLLYR